MYNYTACLCNITDQCDIECCCDSDCSTSLINGWKQFNYCWNDGMGIPFCSSLTDDEDINVLDMYSGLRTIYTVIKRLFCISSINFVEPSDWYSNIISNGDFEVQSIVNDESITNTELNILPNSTIKGLPLLSGSGQCGLSNVLTYNNQYDDSCRVFIASIGDVTGSILSIATIEGVNSLDITINKFKSTDISSSSALSTSNLVTSCTGTSCSNVIRLFNIIINS